MFSLRTSPLAQRTLGALDLARSFLMLEDDDRVDWEVDRNELERPVHPHRAPLRRRLLARRPGATVPRPQVCVSPTFYGEPAARGNQRAERRDRIPACRMPPAPGGWPSGGMETPSQRHRHTRPAGAD